MWSGDGACISRSEGTAVGFGRESDRKIPSEAVRKLRHLFRRRPATQRTKEAGPLLSLDSSRACQVPEVVVAYAKTSTSIARGSHAHESPKLMIAASRLGCDLNLERAPDGLRSCGFRSPSELGISIGQAPPREGPSRRWFARVTSQHPLRCCGLTPDFGRGTPP